jgi:hypothetical protein
MANVPTFQVQLGTVGKTPIIADLVLGVYVEVTLTANYTRSPPSGYPIQAPSGQTASATYGATATIPEGTTTSFPEPEADALVLAGAATYT